MQRTDDLNSTNLSWQKWKLNIHLTGIKVKFQMSNLQPRYKLSIFSILCSHVFGSRSRSPNTSIFSLMRVNCSHTNHHHYTQSNQGTAMQLMMRFYKRPYLVSWLVKDTLSPQQVWTWLRGHSPRWPLWVATVKRFHPWRWCPQLQGRVSQRLSE